MEIDLARSKKLIEPNQALTLHIIRTAAGTRANWPSNSSRLFQSSPRSLQPQAATPIAQSFARRFPRIVCKPRFNAVHDQGRDVARIDSQFDESKIWNFSLD